MAVLIALSHCFQIYNWEKNEIDILIYFLNKEWHNVGDGLTIRAVSGKQFHRIHQNFRPSCIVPERVVLLLFFSVLIVIQWFWTSDWKLMKYTCKVFLNIRTYEIPKIKHLCVYYFSSYFVPKSEINQMQKLTLDFNTHWCTQKKNSPLRSKLRI